MRNVNISKKGRKLINEYPLLVTAIVAAVSSSDNQKALNSKEGLKVFAGGKCVTVKSSRP